MFVRECDDLKLPNALNIAKNFAINQLNAVGESVTFISANLVGTNWEITCSFKEKTAKMNYGTTIYVSDISGEVTSFTTLAAKAQE